MDTDKAAKLRLAHYQIKPCCGLCRHARLTPDGWGTCAQHLYEHQKHTGALREMSINQYGVCDSFVALEPWHRKILDVLHFKEFLSKGLINPT